MITAATADAYKLFHEGSLALADVEHAGMRVDVPRLNKAIADIDAKVKRLTDKLKNDEVFKLWRREYGLKTKLSAPEQLGHILYDVLKYPCVSWTAPSKRFPHGQRQVSKEAIAHIDLPFLKRHSNIEKLKDVKGTFLEGIRKELVGEFVHPFQNLAGGGDVNSDEDGGARSYRSSSQSPNAHNFPGRDGESAETVRSNFIPRDGHLLIENDFKGAEVCISCIYNQDPTLAAYIKDPKKDMHRDAAMKLYKLKKLNDKETQVSKNTRYVAKNSFTFAQFYGSYYKDCARNLWEQIKRMNLCVAVEGEKEKSGSGISLYEHLANKGITKLGKCENREESVPGTFEYHVKEVEHIFWYEDFPVYTQWKEDWYRAYRETGGFDMLTGFRVEGIYRKNQVLNYAVQGSSFHCLLWCLIQMNKWLKKYKMRSKIICQIHDSILGDVHEKEKDDYLSTLKEIVNVRLPKAWKWINLPLTIECEQTGLCGTSTGNWYCKKEIENF